MRAALALIAVATLSACVPAPPALGPQVPASVARAQQVAQTMEPVAERVCRAETPQLRCDFTILLALDPEAGVNAFQTFDPDTGAPILILTRGLVETVRNADELAFVIGHEAAHHIAQHISATQSAAEIGAQIFSASAREQGASADDIMRAADLGALVGSRQFSQSAELEADILGTIIACRAGFDPVIGARFFTQLPDPGAQILGTHPPNAARIAAVTETAAARC